MLENQLLVVQKLFQWEGCDPNWIHKKLSRTMSVSGWSKSLRKSKTMIKNTLNQWQWQPAWNDEDLGQSVLIEAHGDCAGSKIIPWELRIGKRRWILMCD